MLIDTDFCSYRTEVEVDWHMYADTYIEEKSFSFLSSDLNMIIHVTHKTSTPIRGRSRIVVNAEVLKKTEKNQQYLENIGSFYLSQTDLESSKLIIKQSKPFLFKTKQLKEKIDSLKQEHHQPVFSKVITIDSLFRPLLKQDMPFSSRKATDLFLFCEQTCAKENIVLDKKDIRITTIKELSVNKEYRSVHFAEMIQEINFYDSLYITFRVWQASDWYYKPIEIRRV